MEAMLTKLLHISLSAGLIVMGLALLRPLLHKKMSKWVCCLLWGLVAVRLLIPFNVEATVYLPMKAEPPVQEMATGEADQEHLGGTADTPILGGVQTNPNFPIETPNVQKPNTQNPDTQNPNIQIPDTQSPVITPGAQAPSTQNPDPRPQPPMIPTPVLPKIEPWQIAMTVWIGGMVLMLVYSVISILRVHLRVREGVKMEDRIYLCDRISAAFLYGVINPKICLPESLSMRDREYVIAHEQAHLARRDNLWRALGFLLLTIHWFNPLLWLGYALYCRDIELACDEKVIRSHGETYRAPYARALLNCTVRQKPNAITAVEFGKQDIKERIVSIMKKRKTSKAATIILCLLMCLLTFVSCLDPNFVPMEPENEGANKTLNKEHAEQKYQQILNGDFIDYVVLFSGNFSGNTNVIINSKEESDVYFNEILSNYPNNSLAISDETEYNDLLNMAKEINYDNYTLVVSTQHFPFWVEAQDFLLGAITVNNNQINFLYTCNWADDQDKAWGISNITTYVLIKKDDISQIEYSTFDKYAYNDKNNMLYSYQESIKTWVRCENF